MPLPLLFVILATPAWPGMIMTGLQAQQQQPSGVVMPSLLPENVAIQNSTLSSKPCSAGCTDIGNCNAELGECECPFGLTGDEVCTHTCQACVLNVVRHAI